MTTFNTAISQKLEIYAVYCWSPFRQISLFIVRFS